MCLKHDCSDSNCGCKTMFYYEFGKKKFIKSVASLIYIECCLLP